MIELLKLLGNRVKLKPTTVPAHEIETDGVLYIAQLGSDERDLAELQWVSYREEKGQKNEVGFRKYLVAWCLCDAENNRLIDPGQDEKQLTPDFIEAMNSVGTNLPLSLVARLFDVAMVNTGLSEKDTQELVKNSGASQQGAGNGTRRATKARAGRNGSRGSKARKN